ncbi:MAG: Panacea domain-containing protein [Candidatus Aerophobetes bacterium]|nr:Panacea domain-containing protein [Candidatus Aerophobetes bacterium]
MNIYRRKLLNAVLFFASSTKRVNLGKLSKLLYFLDFMHFNQTGYPCIGLKYYAFEKGPVPKDFWLEIRDVSVPEDFKGKIALIQRTDDFAPNYKEVEVRALEKPDLSVFTPRETKILEKLAFMYKEATASDMSEVAHLPKQPWDITRKQKGKNKPIDYLVSISEESAVRLEDAEDTLKEHGEVVHNFDIEPTK